jgi:hypothetical protein
VASALFATPLDLAVQVYALVEVDDPEAIDLFMSEGDTQRGRSASVSKTSRTGAGVSTVLRSRLKRRSGELVQSVRLQHVEC